MKLPRPNVFRFRWLAVPGLALLLCGAAALRSDAGDAPANTPLPADPWTEKQLLDPAELAKVIGDPARKQPILLDIGVASWIRGGLIKGSIVVGPTHDPKHLDQLRDTVSAYPKDADLVIYCGCCPFKDCPNIRPAFTLLQDLKFTRVRLLNLPKNFKTDWVNRGFPTEK